nr:hypothetical protein [Tanacetum cinerariifolium]
MTWHPTWQVNVQSAGGQRRLTVVGPPVNDGDQRWRSTINGGDRRSMVAVNDGRRWRTIVDHRRTTVDHHRTTDQRWLTGSQPTGHRPGQVGSWARSGSGHGPGLDPVRHVCPRGIHVDADLDITTHMGVEPRTSSLSTQGLPQEPAELEHTSSIYM